MDTARYLIKLRREGGDINAFAESAGMSKLYLSHLAAGRKKNPKLETVIDLIRASNGEITLADVRPDLFSGKRGRINLDLLRQSLQ